MRVLFLDDSLLRHAEFRLRSQGHQVTYVRTAAEARCSLAHAPFDLVHLDHDLDGEHYLEVSGGLRDWPAPGDPPTEAGTGAEVVDYIISMPAAARPARVIVHTHNPVGAAMVSRLAAAGIVASWQRF